MNHSPFEFFGEPGVLGTNGGKSEHSEYAILDFLAFLLSQESSLILDIRDYLVDFIEGAARRVSSKYL